MADFEKVWPWVVKWEGGYANYALDHGGATKYGVTLQTFKTFGRDINGDGVINADDVKLMTIDDAKKIAKKRFWDFFNADNIHNQSIAQIIFDFGWASGIVTAAKQIQKVLGLTPDGQFGPATINAINKANPDTLFAKIKAQRIAFVDAIVANHPDQNVWIKGWKNRINSIAFEKKK